MLEFFQNDTRHYRDTVSLRGQVAADCCYTSELALALAHASCAALRSGCALCVADSQGWNSGKYRDALLELLGESVGRTFAVPRFFAAGGRGTKRGDVPPPGPDTGHAWRTLEGSSEGWASW